MCGWTRSSVGADVGPPQLVCVAKLMENPLVKDSRPDRVQRQCPAGSYSAAANAELQRETANEKRKPAKVQPSISAELCPALLVRVLSLNENQPVEKFEEGHSPASVRTRIPLSWFAWHVSRSIKRFKI